VSDQEGFITRWSRRKREADQVAEKPVAADAPDAAASPPPAQDAAAAEAKPPDAPPVDLDTLPPIESITAGSDIRAFLAPGIPVQLTRAALRRAWVADPAIRDFVGLAENAWDFNAPGGVPGFGPSLPAQEVQRMLAEIMGDENSCPSVSASGSSEPSQKPGVSAAADNQPEPRAAPAAPDAPAAEQVTSVPADEAPSDAAVRDEAAQDPPTTLARLHGGALPR
jgi:hypothetical protein